MEATVSDQIISVLDALCDKFGIAIDWSTQNVLPYAQELAGKMINYELWTSVAWLIIGLIPFFGLLSIVVYIIKNCDMDDDTIGGIVVLGACMIIALIVIVIQIFDIIACLTFPEKIIFETIQRMI